MGVVHLARVSANLPHEQVRQLDALAKFWKCTRNEALRRCVEEGLKWSGAAGVSEISVDQNCTKPKAVRPSKAGAKISGVRAKNK